VTTSPHSLYARWFGALFLGCLLGGTVWITLETFQPAAPLLELAVDRAYAPEAMQAALAADAIDELMDTLDGLGNRVPGRSGHGATAAWIESLYRAQGLEVHTLDSTFAAPVTLQRRIEDRAGHPLGSVEIYPFPSNSLQPIATPADGMRGTLVLLDEETLRSRTDFDDAIGVLRMDEVPRLEGLVWTRYAQLGLRALILVHPDGLSAFPWNRIVEAGGMQSVLPINFPRLAATADLLEHLGEEVVLHVTSRFEPVTATTVVGVLRAPQPTREAVVWPVAYDQYGLLPDYTPNRRQHAPLAIHAGLVQGLQAYQPHLQRDMIFVATGGQYAGFAGLDDLLRTVGPRTAAAATAERLARRQAAEQDAYDRVQRVSALFDDPQFLDDLDATVRGRDALATDARALFDEQLRYVLNALVFRMSEEVLQRRMTFERGDTFELDRPEYHRFLAAQFAHDDVATAAGLPLERLLARRAIGAEPPTRFIAHYAVRERLQHRITALRHYHNQQLAKGMEAQAIHAVFAAYGDLLIFHPALLPTDATPSARDTVSFVMGGPQRTFDRAFRMMTPALSSLFNDVLQQGDLRARVGFTPPPGGLPQGIYATAAHYPTPSQNWNSMGYRAFTLLHTDRTSAYRSLAHPDRTPIRAVSMQPGLDFVGQLALALAQGRGGLPTPPQIQVPQYSGRVYVSDVGRSMIPNFPLAGALLAPKPSPATRLRSPGRLEGLHHFTDPYGRYDWPDTSSPFYFDGRYNLQCVYYDDQGQISHIKDESSGTQNLFRSIDLALGAQDFRNVHLVAFRAAPVSVLDLVNPQTLRPYSAVRFLRRGSLTNFERFNELSRPEGVTTFLPPDAYFYVTFRAGTPDNELVQTVRSFMTGADTRNASSDAEIRGDGFLVSDVPILLDIPRQTAQSLIRLNAQRLALQTERGLADRHTVTFHQRSEELLAATEMTGAQRPSFYQRLLTARDALTYAIMVHPILRANITDAVISILWYMGLLVPFIFFFEKLVFGFSDIRKQLAAQVVIFLVVFLLLRILHPAFEMIRSSLMILLGFFILIISMAITILFAGKFRENLEELKQQRGQVSGAEVNTLGVLGTAFMLGLNNMHRRKVRTGLTCATLVLITFAMICFTSIYSDFEDTEFAVGPATYQGLLIKNERFAPVHPTERFAIETRYGHDYVVAPRAMFVGRTTEHQERLNPELEITFTAAAGRVRAMNFGSIVRFTSREPLRHQIAQRTAPYWFEDEEQLMAHDVLPILLPSAMAEQLGIEPASVEAGAVTVTINGTPFAVKGIFDEASYAAMQDLDGRTILPFDVRALTDVERVPGSPLDVLADEDSALMDPSRIVLAPLVPLGITIPNADDRWVSVALDLGDIGYREARREILQFLEQRARPAFYGLDGTAFRGSRMRTAGFAGLIDLLIPLLIAALTVLNTMKGSVYERREEIYVYNAVGIAPRYIFFMFFAEAFVYAVVGCVCGYLLSQGTGAVLTALDLTGGLNMTFAGTNTIYASLAVVAAVFCSTYFPAKSAVEIAAPAEEAGWHLPAPEGDTYAFHLPFTFDEVERTAVLAFFRRYLIDHGEGGAGPFSAGRPRFELDAAPDGPVPRLEAMIWLKPYDLGVSQRMTLATPLDEETGDFIARITITRVSGTREAWQRVNHGFITHVRRQFLHWRAVPLEGKATLHAEARVVMEEDLS
jgi:uncharacterized protein YhhL (DUF1145 family)